MGKLREVIGIIKLSHRQAEGRRGQFLPLCLKYIISLVASLAAFVIWLRNYGRTSNLELIIVAVAAILSIHFREVLHFRIYCLSERYLKRSDEPSPPEPTGMELFGCGATLSAVRWTVTLLMLSPALICFFYGLHYFSLSGERDLFMLLLGAVICLLVGGLIFSAVILAHLDCAEYLFFSGICDSIFAALDTSWIVTSESCGDIVLLKARLLLSGISMSQLCRTNLSGKLVRQQLDKCMRYELYCELRENKFGTQVNLVSL